MNIKQIKEIASRYSPEQIEGCISRQLETGENICLKDGDSEKIINELSKAEVIREMTDKGMSLADAIRELAKRMRAFQAGSEK